MKTTPEQLYKCMFVLKYLKACVRGMGGERGGASEWNNHLMAFIQFFERES